MNHHRFLLLFSPFLFAACALPENEKSTSETQQEDDQTLGESDTEADDIVENDTAEEDENQDTTDDPDDTDTDDEDHSSTENTISILATHLPQSIPESGTSGSLASSSNEAPSGNIVDINVTLDLDHTCTKDLSASLVSPSGTTVVLFDLGNYPVCSSDMENTVLDDQAAQPISSGSNPFHGAYQPLGALSDFNGEDAAGIWTLNFYDSTDGDSGTLRTWSIDLVLD